MFFSFRYVAVLLHAISGVFLVSHVLFFLGCPLNPHLRAYSLLSYNTFSPPSRIFHQAFTLITHPILPTSHTTTFYVAKVAGILHTVARAPQATAQIIVFPFHYPIAKAVLTTTSTYY